MIDEILDALEQYYSNDEESLASILIELSKFNKQDIMSMRYKACARLKDMHRCPYCGDKMLLREYYEWHNELDECPAEKLMIEYCPNGCE